jgi:hypothetical protein
MYYYYSILLSGNICNLVTITDPLNYVVNPENNLEMEDYFKPVIFVTSRVHPGETTSSWVVEVQHIKMSFD